MPEEKKWCVTPYPPRDGSVVESFGTHATSEPLVEGNGHRAHACFERGPGRRPFVAVPHAYAMHVEAASHHVLATESPLEHVDGADVMVPDHEAHAPRRDGVEDGTESRGRVEERSFARSERDRLGQVAEHEETVPGKRADERAQVVGSVVGPGQLHWDEMRVGKTKSGLERRVDHGFE